MPEPFVLIPGRTSKQGTTLNEGKYTDGYKAETSTVVMNPDDMTRLGLAQGDKVCISNETGRVVVTCVPAKPDAQPPGLLFMPYGPLTSELMGGDTHGSGMPDSKGLDVFVEVAESKSESTDCD